MNPRRALLLLVASFVLTACATNPPADPGAALLTQVNAERFIVVTIRNERSALAPRAGSTSRSYVAPSSYSISPATLAQSRSIATTYKLREVTAWPIGLLGVHCLVFELPPGADRADVIDRLRRDRRVESVQPLQSFRTLTGDPYRGLQRNLDAMNVSGAHRWSTGEGVHVAIVDTGVDVKHPDLDGRIAQYRDFVGPATREPISGRHGADRHGTAVAGLIGAIGDNELGIVGVAPGARLHALRACWPSGGSAIARCNTLTLAKALVAAIESRVDIVNLSLGGPTDPLLARLVTTGLRRGIVFVGAMPPSGARESFPTSIPGVISVDVLSSTHPADSTLFAPGEDVLTLTPKASYDFLSGSSLAAASITGGIALLMARKKTLSANEAKALLTASINDTATPVVDLCRAVTSLMRKGNCVTSDE
jgi:hypothetical protein